MKNKLFIYASFFIIALFSTLFSVVRSPYVPDSLCFSSEGRSLPITHNSFTYHQNCDSPEFVKLAESFPNYYKESSVRLSRPGYSFLGNLIHRANNSVNGLIGSILLNFVLAFGASILLYLLVLKLFDGKVAFISSILLLVSPHFHIFLGQAHTEIAGDFVIVASLYLIYAYASRKTQRRLYLVLFSLIIGLLMLVKSVLAIPIFIVLLAIRYKKVPEGLASLALIVMPTAAWIFFVKKGLQIPFVTGEVQLYQQGTWFFSYLTDPTRWDDIIRGLFYTITFFVSDVFLAFLVIPVFFALFGLGVWKYKYKLDLAAMLIISFVGMLFLMLWTGPRLAFGIFPLILPLSVYGYLSLMKRLKQSQFSTHLVGLLLLVTYVATTFLNTYRLIPNYDNSKIRCASEVLNTESLCSS